MTGLMDVDQAPQTRGAGPPATPDPEAALAAEIGQKWQDGSDELARARRDYMLNLAYYLDEQWIWWDKSRRVIQQLPQQYSPLGAGRARVTVNRIAPNLGSVLGRLGKNELVFEVMPSDVADDAAQGAKTAEDVLEAYRRTQHWEATRFDALLASLLGGTSGVSVDWDPRAGKMVTVDPRTRSVVGTGEPALRALNISEFCIEPGVRVYLDAGWWIQALAIPAKAVKRMFDLSWTPRGDVSAMLSPVQRKLLEDAGRPSKDLCLVLTYYERPTSKERPRGKYAITVNDRVVHSEDWPFPFDRLNLALTRTKKIPSQWIGSTYVNSAIPIQFSYNMARSVIAEHMKVAANSRLMAPYGAIDEDAITDDPGGILWFSPDLGGAAPGYLSPPQLPRWMLEEAANLKAELDDTMYVHDTSRGVGFDRASGQALAVLGEQDDSPLSFLVDEQQRLWSDVPRMVLEILDDKAKETRTMTTQAARGIPNVVKFNGKLLRKQFDVHVPREAVTPRTHAADLANAKDLWDRQVITDPRVYAKMVGLRPDQFEELLDADATAAQRENFRIAAGYVEVPQDFEVHSIHIAEHQRWRKSDSYKFADPEIRDVMDKHIQMHENLHAEEVAQQTVRGAIDPALAAMAQGTQPPGSAVPPSAVEQQAAIAQQMGGASPQQMAAGPGAAPQLDAAMAAAPPTPDGGGGQGSPPPGAMAAGQ